MDSLLHSRVHDHEDELEFEPETYFTMMEREDKEDQKKCDARYLELLILCLTFQPTLSIPTPKRQRTTKQREVWYMEPDGTIAILTPKKTFWY